MNGLEASHLVRIHIDRQPCESPSPTTGAALYALANIPHHRDLFREVDGDHEDELIERDDREIGLKPDEHYYSERTVTIIVNGSPHQEIRRRLSYDTVVKIAFPVPPPGQNIAYTVAFRNGPRRNPTGTLVQGQSVLIKDGMIFDVTATDRS